jgi:hypothetical protein
MKPIPLLVVLLMAGGSVGFAAAASQDSPGTPSWQLALRNDAARDYPYTRFTLAGKFVNTDGAAAPSMIVDCDTDRASHPLTGRVLSASVSAGAALKIIYVEPLEIHGTSYFPKVAVRYRTDGAPEERQDWPAGPDKLSAVIPNESLARILRARSIAIIAEDNRGAPVTMRFDLPNSTSVREGCDVK